MIFIGLSILLLLFLSGCNSNPAISEDNNVIQYCRASTSCGYVMTGVFCPEDRYEWEVEINYLRYRCYNPYAVKLNDIFERWDRL